MTSCPPQAEKIFGETHKLHNLYDFARRGPLDVDGSPDPQSKRKWLRGSNGDGGRRRCEAVTGRRTASTYAKVSIVVGRSHWTSSSEGPGQSQRAAAVARGIGGGSSGNDDGDGGGDGNGGGL